MMPRRAAAPMVFREFFPPVAVPGVPNGGEWVVVVKDIGNLLATGIWLCDAPLLTSASIDPP